MLPKLMFVLVDAVTFKRGYRHTHLVYVAEQWEREGKPNVLLWALQDEVVILAIGNPISHQVLESLLLER